MTGELKGLLNGVGVLGCVHSDTVYALAANGVWVAFAANEPVLEGGTYSGGVWYGNANSAWVVQPAMENAQVRSWDLTNAAWTKSSMGTVLVTGMRGDADGATALTANGANATAIGVAGSTASAPSSARFWAKRLVGSGGVDLTVDGGSTWQEVTGVLDAGAGEWVELLVDQEALTAPQIGVRLQNNGDSISVGNAERHEGKRIEGVRGSGPIFTTTAAVSTGAVTYSFSAQNYPGTGLAYVEMKPMGMVDGQGYLGEMGVLWFDQDGSAGGRLLGLKYL